MKRHPFVVHRALWERVPWPQSAYLSEGEDYYENLEAFSQNPFRKTSMPVVRIENPCRAHTLRRRPGTQLT